MKFSTYSKLSSYQSFTAGLLLGLVVFVLFFARGAIAAWVDPSAAPPGGDIEPPINTSSADQFKKGSLGINCGNNCPTGPIDPLIVYNSSGIAVMTVTAAGVLTTNTISVTNFSTQTFSVTGDAAVGGSASVVGSATIGQTLAVTGTSTFKNKVNVGEALSPVNISGQDASSVYALSDGQQAALFARQSGPKTAYAAYFNGRTQINTLDELRYTDANALSIYASSLANGSGLYIEDQGSGKAATFSGNVLIKRQGGAAGQLVVGETGDRVTGVGKSAITAYAGNNANAISGESTDEVAIRGKSDSLFGVEGISGSGTGVRGLSQSGTGTGVLGNSVGGIGVSGTTTGTAASSAGVSATSSTTAPGLVANNSSGTGPSAIFKNGDVQVQQDLGINVDKQLRFNEDDAKDAYFEYDDSEQCLRLNVGGQRVAAWPDPIDGTCRPNCSAGGGHCLDDALTCMSDWEPAPNYYCPVNTHCCVPDDGVNREY